MSLNSSNGAIEFGDFIGIWSLLLGYENLYENREQSKHNDVSAANDVQARYLLEELGQKFDEQNDMLAYQNKLLEQILEEVKNK